MNGDEMNRTEHPDPIDELLRHRVRSGVPDGPDAATVDAELVELAPRFRRARQRRQAAVATVASAAAVVLVVVGAFSLGGNGAQRIDTADDDGGVTSTSLAPTSTTSTTSTTVPTTVPTTAAPTSVPGTTAAPTTAPGGDGSPPPPTIAPPTVPPATTVAPPTTAPVGGTRTLTSPGGSATVRWTANSITVLSTSPAPGWSLDEVDQRSPTRVRIDFRRDGGGSGSDSSSIDARVVDGRLEVDS